MAKKNPCQGKHREFKKICQNTGNFCLNTGKTQGVLLAQVVNVLILKVKNILIVAAKKSFSPQKLDGSAKSVCVCNSHKLCKLAQGKCAVRQGKHREFKNKI